MHLGTMYCYFVQAVLLGATDPWRGGGGGGGWERLDGGQCKPELSEHVQQQTDFKALSMAASAHN